MRYSEKNCSRPSRCASLCSGWSRQAPRCSSVSNLDDGDALTVLGREILVGDEARHGRGELVHASSRRHEVVFGPRSDTRSKHDDNHDASMAWRSDAPFPPIRRRAIGHALRRRASGGPLRWPPRSVRLDDSASPAGVARVAGGQRAGYPGSPGPPSSPPSGRETARGGPGQRDRASTPRECEAVLRRRGSGHRHRRLRQHGLCPQAPREDPPVGGEVVGHRGARAGAGAPTNGYGAHPGVHTLRSGPAERDAAPHSISVPARRAARVPGGTMPGRVFAVVTSPLRADGVLLPSPRSSSSGGRSTRREDPRAAPGRVGLTASLSVRRGWLDTLRGSHSLTAPRSGPRLIRKGATACRSISMCTTRSRADRRRRQGRPPEGPGGPAQVRRQLPPVLVRRGHRQGLLPGRGAEQGSGGGRPPRGPRPGRRRDHRGEGRLLTPG